MRQGFKAENRSDAQGNPSGGQVLGTGIIISWQDGPLKDAAGNTKEPNGAFVEDVIDAARQRLAYFQGSKFKCKENADAIAALELALEALDSRTKRRVAAGVEGTHGADKTEGLAAAAR